MEPDAILACKISSYSTDLQGVYSSFSWILLTNSGVFRDCLGEVGEEGVLLPQQGKWENFQDTGEAEGHAPDPSNTPLLTNQLLLQWPILTIERQLLRSEFHQM